MDNEDKALSGLALMVTLGGVVLALIGGFLHVKLLVDAGVVAIVVSLLGLAAISILQPPHSH